MITNGDDVVEFDTSERLWSHTDILERLLSLESADIVSIKYRGKRSKSQSPSGEPRIFRQFAIITTECLDLPLTVYFATQDQSGHHAEQWIEVYRQDGIVGLLNRVIQDTNHPIPERIINSERRCSRPTLRKIAFLISKGILETVDSSEEVSGEWEPAINTNDFFAHACADCTRISFDEVERVYECYQEWKETGTNAWVSLKEQMDPFKGWMAQPNFREVRELIRENKALCPLHYTPRNISRTTFLKEKVSESASRFLRSVNSLRAIATSIKNRCLRIRQ